MSVDIYSLYKTTNLINGKIYYGVHKETKWPQVDRYLGSGLLLRNAVKKHGEKNFKREILCISDNQEYIYYLESLIVTEEFILEDTNYNLCGGGYGASVRTEETRKKMSDALKGENHPRYGKSLSEEHKQKLSDAKRGERNPNYGKPGTMLGRTHSSDSLQRMRMSSVGRIPSEETRKKMSAARKGKKISPETIEKRIATRRAKYGGRYSSTDNG